MHSHKRVLTTTPLFLLVALASSTECGDHVLLDAGVIGLGDNPGTKLLPVGAVTADCVIPAPADVVVRI